MPKSKKRKKNGKVVQRSSRSRDIPRETDSALTLQDLINVVAWMETKKPCYNKDQGTCNVNVCVAEGCYDESCLDRVSVPIVEDHKNEESIKETNEQ